MWNPTLSGCFLPVLDQGHAYFSRQQDIQPHSNLEVADAQLSVSFEEFWDKPCGVYTQLLAEGIETSTPLCSLSKAHRCQLQGEDSEGRLRDCFDFPQGLQGPIPVLLAN